jgi:hypothetical protein
MAEDKPAKWVSDPLARWLYERFDEGEEQLPWEELRSDYRLMWEKWAYVVRRRVQEIPVPEGAYSEKETRG